MENIAFKHPWVFYLDADERMTPELLAEIGPIAPSRHTVSSAHAGPRPCMACRNL